MSPGRRPAYAAALPGFNLEITKTDLALPLVFSISVKLISAPASLLENCSAALLVTFCAAILAVRRFNLPLRITSSWIASPTRVNPILLRTSLERLISSPFTRTITSPATIPALSAADLGSTRATTTPLLCSRPNACASSGVRSWAVNPSRPRLTSPCSMSCSIIC